MSENVTKPNLQAEADPLTLAALRRVLRADFRKARSAADLNRRLAFKGFLARGGVLMTAPHGKHVCALSQVMEAQ